MKSSLENPFDQYIKESLENYQAPYDEGSWELLQAKVDAAAAKDVDQLARESLQDFSVPYNPASWQVLSNRLENLDYQRKLIALKLVEAAIIVLALITVIRFVHQVPSSPDQQNRDDRVQEMAVVDPASSSQERNDVSGKSENDLTLAEADLQANADERSEIVTTQRSNANFRQSKKTLVEKTQPAIPSREELNIAPLPLAMGGVEAPQNDLATAKTNSLETDFRDRNPLHPLDEVAHKPGTLRAKKNVVFASLAGIPTKTAKVIMHGDMPIALVAPKLKKTSFITTKVGAYRQLSNHSVSFIGQARQINTREVKKTGGLGVMTAVQFGKVGFDFGLAYGAMRYSGSLSDVDLRKAQVPVHLRVIPVSNRYFEVYLKGGATAHGVLYAWYEEPLTGRSSSVSEYVPKFNDGLLFSKNGFSEQNLYFSINGGIGIEAKIIEDWSLFVEGLVQRHHSGDIGYDATKINTLSLNLGIYRTL